MSSKNRESILKKLGLTEEDVRDSEKLLRQIPPPPPPHLLSTSSSIKRQYGYCTKAECVLGYTLLRLSREKALRVLGASEEEIDIENAKTLGSLGRSGRRRSFVVHDIITKGELEGFTSCLKKRKISRVRITKGRASNYRRTTSFRRRSTGDLNFLKFSMYHKHNEYVKELKKRNNDANAEIDHLRQRLEVLEKEVLGKKVNMKLPLNAVLSEQQQIQF